MTGHPEINSVWFAKRRAVAMAMVMDEDDHAVMVAYMKIATRKERPLALKSWDTGGWGFLSKRIVGVALELDPLEFNARCRDAGCGEVKA